MSFLSRLFNAVPKEEREGIFLDCRARQWKVSEVKDLPAFLRALTDLLPSGCILYLEGGTPAGPLKAFLEERSVPEHSHVAMGTIWPRPVTYHVPATSENLAELADIAERCATAEVAVHLHVYLDGKVLLQWYDAFFDPFYISSGIPESCVKAFCEKLELKYDTESVE